MKPPVGFYEVRMIDLQEMGLKFATTSGKISPDAYTYLTKPQIALLGKKILNDFGVNSKQHDKFLTVCSTLMESEKNV
jgi:hypothetical protein